MPPSKRAKGKEKDPAEPPPPLPTHHPPARRLTYGNGKYAALHLLMARALRIVAPQDALYQYVTLGGTELRDTRSLHYIDGRLTAGAVSFEMDPNRFPLAQATADRLRVTGPDVEVVHDSFFRGFTRPNADRPHLFFVDLEGRCAFSEFDREFGRLFRRGYIAENDILLITSFLGGRQRRERVEEEYDAEFRILNVTTVAAKHDTFRTCHPAFTLYRALRDADMQDVLEVKCFGFATYMDSSPMGVYGYSIRAGRTDLRSFLNPPMLELYGSSW